MTNDLLPLLQSALQQQKITVAQEHQKQIVAYLVMLQKWNQTFNLTSITNPHDMIWLHIIDSLLIEPYLQGKRFLDVGTGAGLPGMVLAITNPQQQWTLLDKNNKKTRFLTQVVAEIGLKNVEVVLSKSEDFHPSQPFDSILSRALGSLTFFLETTQHLHAHNGIYLALKGKYPAEEIQEIQSNARILKIVPLTMTNRQAERHLVIFTA
jgi:16S rRNA (guanine527-N7)-methyltransferase